ncbi:MgtC/SapB family protein [Halochromatium sp.]
MTGLIEGEEQRILLELAVALAIGLLFGLERGWHGEQEAESKKPAGVRTFGLIGLLGGVGGVIAQALSPIVLGLLFVALATVAVGSYLLHVRENAATGSTSLIAELLAFALAALSTLGHETEAASAAVIATLLLGFKPQLHRWLARLEQTELHATLKLLLITVVLLPVLPDQGYGPAKALNPYELWWLVVLIATISYVGYFAIKVLGANGGITLTGLLAGLASSTALTLQMARIARRQGAHKGAHQGAQANLIATGILIANTTLFPRILVIVALLKPALALALAAPLIGMTLLTLVPTLAFWLRRGAPLEAGALQVSNPLALGQALRFGLLLAVVMLVARISAEIFGSAGLLGVAAVSGAADLNAITLSIARMELEQIGERTALIAILIALTTNTLFKTLLCATIAGPRLAWRIGLSLSAALLAGFAIVLSGCSCEQWIRDIPLSVVDWR